MSELLEEIRKLFFSLSDEKVVDFLVKNGLDFYDTVEFDENNLKNIIEKLNNCEYYITETIVYNGNYWDEYDYECRDSFSILPISKALSYLFCINKI